MKQPSIFKIVGIGLMLNGISTANGALLESNRQNTTGTSSQPVSHPKDRDYDRYSEHTRELVEESKAKGRADGIAEGRADGIASIIKAGLLPYDKFMSSDHYSDAIKAAVRLLLETSNPQ
jgi:hypothetical protein